MSRQNPNRLYIGNIPSVMDRSDFDEWMFEYGQVTDFRYYRGFAFIVSLHRMTRHFTKGIRA
jgi:hypothetical protein